MNTRQAILAAANQLEKTPDRFSIISIQIPDPNVCGTPGCFLGWIAYFLGYKVGNYGYTHALNDLNIDEDSFYTRIAELDGSDLGKKHIFRWDFNTAHVPGLLRLYADRYHPARPAIPSLIKDLFNAPTQKVSPVDDSELIGSARAQAVAELQEA